MKLRNFFIGRAVVLLSLIVIGGLLYGLYSLNAYLYSHAPEPIGVGDVPAQNSQATSTEPDGIVVKDFEGEADPAKMKLDMKAWNWISTTYNDGKQLKPGTEKPFILTLNKDGTFSVRTDCNGIGGKYFYSAHVISFSEVFMTEMYCQGSQDAAFANMLSQIDSFHFTSKGELVFDFKFDSGSAVFR